MQTSLHFSETGSEMGSRKNTIPLPQHSPLSFLLVVLCLSHLIPSVATAALSGEQIAREVLPQVVTVRKYDASGLETGAGSGFIIADGRVVTNAHVVCEAAWVEIYNQDDQIIGSAPYALAVNARSDLVVLPLWHSPQPGLQLSSAVAEVGQDIWVFGAPLGLSGTVSRGIVSSYRAINDLERLQITAPVSAGSSGGPIVNNSGEVVGVVLSVLTEGQNLNFAVPVADLLALLDTPVDRHPVSFGCPSDSEPNETDPAVVAARLSLMLGLTYADSIGYGAAVGGALTADDYEVDGPWDFYTFARSAGESVKITVSSAQMDVVATVRRASDLFADDAWEVTGVGTAGGRDATIRCDAPTDDNYYLFIKSRRGQHGGYQVNMDVDQVSTRALDSRWQQVAKGEGTTIYVDQRTLSNSGDVLNAWVLFVNNEPTVDPDGQTYDSTQQRMRINCREQKFAIAAYVKILGGNVVGNRDIAVSAQSWSSAVPGTLGEVLLDYFCVTY